MRIKLSSTLAGTAVLAFAAASGDTGLRRRRCRRAPGAADCTALATAQFATVTALSTTYDAGLDDASRPTASCAAPRRPAPAPMASRTRHASNCACRPTWSGRFLYQGGGGNDGAVAPAVGRNTGSFPDTGLQRGFAVVTTDAGHQGVTAEFGLDPVARVDHAYAAHERTYTIAMAILSRYYGRAPDRKYFVGCSGGGRQGMMFAQRYPTYFDGIAICAPAMSVSSGATIAAAWDTQTYLSARSGRCERTTRSQPRVQRRRPGARRARHHGGVRRRRRRGRRDGPPPRRLPLRSEDVAVRRYEGRELPVVRAGRRARARVRRSARPPRGARCMSDRPGIQGSPRRDGASGSLARRRPARRTRRTRR